MTDHIKHITTLVKKMNSRLIKTLKNIKGSTTKSMSRKITEIQKHNIELSFILIDIISNYRDLIPAEKRDKLELDIINSIGQHEKKIWKYEDEIYKIIDEENPNLRRPSQRKIFKQIVPGYYILDKQHKLTSTFYRSIYSAKNENEIKKLVKKYHTSGIRKRVENICKQY
jgi:hypothetical protein